MTKQFKGFTADQTMKIAAKLGFNGPLEEFDSFLQSTPKAASMFANMSRKAKDMAEGRINFAAGGVVDTKTGQPPAPTAAQKADPKAVAWAGGLRLTDQKENKTGMLKAGRARIDGFSNRYDDKEGARADIHTLRSLAHQGVPLVDLQRMAASGQIDAKYSSSVSGAPQTNQPVSQTSAGTMQQIQKRVSDPAAVVPKEAIAKTANIKTNANQYIPSLTGRVDADGLNIKDVALPPEVKAQQAALVDPEVAFNKTKEMLEQEFGEPVQGSPSEMATVRGQMADMFDDFDPANPPPWAAGAMRQANQAMAARGLGSSSMAGAAVAQAAMEAGIDIAKVDAATYALFERENLTREQQHQIMSFQALSNALLSDTAQVNAAKQFNAQSENQMTQFFENLKSNIDTIRAASINDNKKFNAELQNVREQFNSTNALAIASANTQWRQKVTTINTAAQNLNNQINAALMAAVSENAFNAAIQLERDEMAYLDAALTRGFQSGENALQRKTDLLIATMQRDLQKRISGDETDRAFGESVGNVVGKLAPVVLDKVFTWWGAPA